MLPCRIVSKVTQLEAQRTRYQLQVAYTPAGKDSPVGVICWVDARGKCASMEAAEAKDVPFVSKAKIRASVWWHVSNNWRKHSKKPAA